MSGEVVVLILVGIFGAIAAGLVVYGLLQSRREPKSQIKAATTPVAKTVTTPTKTQSKTPVSERFCEKCYAIIPGDLEFCSECGARQD